MSDRKPAAKVDGIETTPAPTIDAQASSDHEPQFDDPVEAIRFYMGEKGFTQRDLVPMIW